MSHSILQRTLLGIATAGLLLAAASAQPQPASTPATTGSTAAPGSFAESMKREQENFARRAAAQKAEAEAKKKAEAEAFAALPPLEMTIDGLGRDAFRSAQMANLAKELRTSNEARLIRNGVFKDRKLDAAEEQLVLALQSPKFRLTLHPAPEANIPVKEVVVVGAFNPEAKALLAELKPAPGSTAYEVWLKNPKDPQARNALVNAFKSDGQFRERALRYAAATLGEAWEKKDFSGKPHNVYQQQLAQWAHLKDTDPQYSDYDWRAASLWLFEAILLHSRISGGAVPEYYYELLHTPAPQAAREALQSVNAMSLDAPPLRVKYLESK